MGYPQKVRERAFDLYLKHRNVEKVAEIMRRDYKYLAVSTVKRWASEYNWKERADRADENRAKRVDPDVSPLELLVDEVAEIRERVKAGLDLDDEDLASGKSIPKKITGKEAQAIYAYRGLVQVEAKLQETVNNQKKREGRETTPDVIFAALNKHPKFAKLLSSQKVLAELMEIIDAEQMEAYRRAAA